MIELSARVLQSGLLDPRQLTSGLVETLSSFETFKTAQQEAADRGSAVVNFEIPGLPGRFSFRDQRQQMTEVPSVLNQGPMFQPPTVREALGLPCQGEFTLTGGPGFNYNFREATLRTVDLRYGKTRVSLADMWEPVVRGKGRETPKSLQGAERFQVVTFEDKQPEDQSDLSVEEYIKRIDAHSYGYVLHAQGDVLTGERTYLVVADPYRSALVLAAQIIKFQALVPFRHDS